MLAEDPALAREFEGKLQSDDQFRNNPKARLQWFYQRTPFYDDRAGLYPVAREINPNEDYAAFLKAHRRATDFHAEYPITEFLPDFRVHVSC
jgi:hypothetical protein